MIDKSEVLRILNKERENEEKIANDLSYYMEHSLGFVGDMTDLEKEDVKKVLAVIAKESYGHYMIFTKLIERAIEDEEFV